MCDTVVTLASDGVLFAKNSDRDPNEAQLLEWHPAATHRTGSTVECTWIEVPQVARTHAVLLSRPWWMWGAEIGANDHGVTIGNEAVFTDQPHGDPALLGMDLLRLALERAATAHDAVSVIVDLLERHGQGGSCSHAHPRFTYHNSFLVADADGAVVLETAGRLWATEEVRGPARAISNGLTIAGFADAHADRLRGRVAQCAARRSLTGARASTATTPGDLIDLLRDHGSSASPRWSPVNGAMAAPCMHAGGLVTSSQTTASWVADLRGTPRHWVTATAAPCTSLFKPVAVDAPVDLGPPPADRADAATLWWRHERLHRATMRDHGALVARYRHARDRTEAGWLADPPTAPEAFAEADRLESAWAADVIGSALPDRRPRWVRDEWARHDAAAGLASAGLTVAGVAPVAGAGPSR